MFSTHQEKSKPIKNPEDVCVATLSIESRNRATIIAIDKNKLNRIKRTLESCIRMSATDGGEHKLDFSIKEQSENFLSLFSTRKNELVMEGNIARGLEYLKTFLSNNSYIDAMQKLSVFNEKIKTNSF